MAEDPLESAQPLAPEPRYGTTAIAFHWAVAALVVVVGTLGLLHDEWPKTTQSYWINVHALLGLLLWGVVIARLAWRMRHAPPVLPNNVGPFARRLSSPVHFALYGLLLLIPIVGIITFIYHGRVFDFGLFRLDFASRRIEPCLRPPRTCTAIWLTRCLPLPLCTLRRPYGISSTCATGCC
jgi:cytochrome b561